LFRPGSVGAAAETQDPVEAVFADVGAERFDHRGGWNGDDMGLHLGSSGCLRLGSCYTCGGPYGSRPLVPRFGMLAVAWHVETDPASTPRWLPISMAIGVATSTLGLWQALIAAGMHRSLLLPAVVLGGGCVDGPDLRVDGLTGTTGTRQAAGSSRQVRHFSQKLSTSVSTGSFSWHNG